MSVTQKLAEWYLEMDSGLNKVREELDRLQAERDQAVEHAARLQAELAATHKALQNGMVRDVSHYTEAAEVDRPIEPQPQPIQVCEGRWQTRNGEIFNVTPTPECRIHTSDSRAERFPWWDAQYRQTWCANGKYHFGRESSLDLVTYLGPIESEPEQEFKPYTFAAYIVGDKSQPDALRIVWATEEWIQHANFGIVHRMSDLKFSGNDTFTPDPFSVNLKVQ